MQFDFQEADMSEQDKTKRGKTIDLAAGYKASQSVTDAKAEAQAKEDAATAKFNTSKIS